MYWTCCKKDLLLLVQPSFWELFGDFGTCLLSFSLKEESLYQYAFRLPDFYLYFVNLVLVSIIMHWIYNNTKRSILSPVLMHSMLLILVNFGAWHWYSESIIYYSATLLITCVGIVYYFGAKNFNT